MEQFKQLILQHFEKVLVGVILIVAFAGTYLTPLGCIKRTRI